VDQLGFKVMPEWMPDQPKEKASLLICQGDKQRTPEILRAALLKKSGSRLNFRHGCFFGTAA
jgi:hypothetical protein